MVKEYKCIVHAGTPLATVSNHKIGLYNAVQWVIGKHKNPSYAQMLYLLVNGKFRKGHYEVRLIRPYGR